VQVSVNVLARRGAEAALACLGHLRGRLPEGVRVRLLHDGACDATRAAVAREFPEVALVRVPGDGGFAAAHNRGLQRAFGELDDAVLVLSLDARPLAGFLPPLVEVMRMRPRAAFVSPKVLLASDPGVLWYAGGRIDWWRGHAAPRGAGARDDGRYDRPGPTDFATAVAMLVRRQAVDRAGPMDASYRDHLHDVDWSLRARRVGMEVHYQPRSRVLYEPPPGDDGGAWVRLRTDTARDGASHAGQTLQRSRMRLVADHGRWYHWPTAAPRVAAAATSTALRGWRRVDVEGPGDSATPAPPRGPQGPAPTRRPRP